MPYRHNIINPSPEIAAIVPATDVCNPHLEAPEQGLPVVVLPDPSSSLSPVLGVVDDEEPSSAVSPPPSLPLPPPFTMRLHSALPSSAAVVVGVEGEVVVVFVFFARSFSTPDVIVTAVLKASPVTVVVLAAAAVTGDASEYAQTAEEEEADAVGVETAHVHAWSRSTDTVAGP